MNSGYLLIDLLGTELTAEERELLAHPGVAGLVLFSRNYQSKKQLADLTRSAHTIKPDCIIAADQEGGRVQRFCDGFTTLPAMRHWGEQYHSNPQLALKQLQHHTEVMVRELQAVGVNVSICPVLDRDYGLSEVIGSRSFSDDVDVITTLASTVINTMQGRGMPAVAKHFPGHGAVAVDSHTDLPLDQRSQAEIFEQDVVPFIRLQDKYAALMPAHILFPKIDKRPVTFSSYWIRDLLRTQLGYNKLVMSDDLTMQAAASIGGYSERAGLALDAGCDVLLACNNRLGAISILEKIPLPKEPARVQRLAEFTGRIQCYSPLVN